MGPRFFSRRGPRRRSLRMWVLVAAFVIVPIVEIYVIIQVGRALGPWGTTLLLIPASISGAWLIGREGRKAWQSLMTAMASGKPPARELADGALILIGGTLTL